MTCSLCGDTALRVVGTKGFCKVHEADAFKEGSRSLHLGEGKRVAHVWGTADVAIRNKYKGGRSLRRDIPIYNI